MLFGFIYRCFAFVVVLDLPFLETDPRICDRNAFSGILLVSVECDFQQNDTEMWIWRKKIDG